MVDGQTKPHKQGSLTVATMKYNSVKVSTIPRMIVKLTWHMHVATRRSSTSTKAALTQLSQRGKPNLHTYHIAYSGWWIVNNSWLKLMQAVFIGPPVSNTYRCLSLLQQIITYISHVKTQSTYSSCLCAIIDVKMFGSKFKVVGHPLKGTCLSVCMG